LATVEVFSARLATTWRREWRVRLALDGPARGGLIVGTGVTRSAALADALATLDVFTDLVMVTLTPPPVAATVQQDATR